MELTKKSIKLSFQKQRVIQFDGSKKITVTHLILKAKLSVSFQSNSALSLFFFLLSFLQKLRNPLKSYNSIKVCLSKN